MAVGVGGQEVETGDGDCTGMGEMDAGKRVNGSVVTHPLPVPDDSSTSPGPPSSFFPH